MGNDEKATSRKDETPNPAEKEEKPTLKAVGDDASPLPFSEMDDDEAAGDDRPAPGGQSSSSLEAEVGMPAFGFFHDALKQAKKVEPAKEDALLAAKAGLDSAGEGTGWETIDSIGAPANGPGAPGAEMSLGEQGSTRVEATVMPFPGAIHRQPEPAPSEMLGGLAEGRDANLFDGAPAETAPDFEDPGHDTIADAVQSALRNVYGGAMSQQEDELPDFGSISVADSLKQAAAQSAEAEDFWSERGAQWSGDEAEDGYAPRKSETDTDAVLDYLYGERRSRQQPFAPGEASLRDLGESLGYERDSRGRFEPEERDLGDRGVLGGRGFDEPPFRQYSERGSRSYSPEASAYREPPAVEPEWGAPPYVTSSAGPRLQDGQYPAPIAGGESLAAGSPDSSHLLGAAGLGLIGGIALAGVLAVFAFNSINVEDGGERTVAEAPPPAKVIERLGAGEEPTAPRAEAPQPRTEAALERPAAIQPAPAPRPVTRAEPQVQAAAPPVERAAPQPAPAAPQPEPRLKAEDAAGDPGEAIPLDITIAKSEDREATLISLKGLPLSAKLSTGIDVGGGQWLLPPAKLGSLTVTTAPNVEGRFSIEAELLKDDAQTAIFGPVVFTLHVGNPPAKDTGETAPAGADRFKAASHSDTITPAAAATAAPERGAQVASLAEGQAETDFLTQMLIRDGNKLMRDGDIIAARRLYEQAAANGNPEAALAMGRSYDPSYFEKLPVKTGKPDPATAFEWYKKALDGGLVTARVKIDGLKQWLQR